MVMLEKPITTQEDLEVVIGERLKQDRESQAKKFEGWVSPEVQAEAANTAKKQVDELTKQLEKAQADTSTQLENLQALQAQNHKYEIEIMKQRVAHEVGLDWALADRLTGETEEDIRKDAEDLKLLVKATGAPPLRTYESDKGTQNAETAWKDVLSKLKGE
jgi:hypothetical protein